MRTTAVTSLNRDSITVVCRTNLAESYWTVTVQTDELLRTWSVITQVPTIVYPHQVFTISKAVASDFFMYPNGFKKKSWRGGSTVKVQSYLAKCSHAAIKVFHALQFLLVSHPATLPRGKDFTVCLFPLNIIGNVLISVTTLKYTRTKNNSNICCKHLLVKTKLKKKYIHVYVCIVSVILCYQSREVERAKALPSCCQARLPFIRVISITRVPFSSNSIISLGM